LQSQLAAAKNFCNAPYPSFRPLQHDGVRPAWVNSWGGSLLEENQRPNGQFIAPSDY
jgi:hypothetical protein